MYQVFAMPTLTINSIPDSLYQQLKSAAELNRRSINNEVLIYLERALQHLKIKPEERLKRIEQLRASIKPNNNSAEDIETAIHTGRP